jgi:predicted kinase
MTTMPETPAVAAHPKFRLICTVGLPRSGKSTWAKATEWPIVNPDSIRLALHGQRFFGPAEPLVWAIAHLMVEALRLAGNEAVILDATNVQQKRRAEWEAAYPGALEYRLVPTPPEVCIARAMAQNDAEIIPVIERMAQQWDYPERWEGYKAAAPRSPEATGTALCECNCAKHIGDTCSICGRPHRRAPQSGEGA